MPRRKEPIFEAGRPFHVLGNAVEKRGIFETPQDCARFIFQMYAANIGSPVPNLHRVDMSQLARILLGARHIGMQGKEMPEKFVIPEHPPLVEIFSFVLARDHYHFGLVPTQRDGIPRYMQKLNLGFAKYYNLKHKRKGSLFETRFKAAPIRNPRQLEALVQHINVKNVLDVYKPNWHKYGFDDEDLAIEFLGEYPYSSFPDLFMKRNSALISENGRNELRKFLRTDFLKTRESFLRVFQAYIKEELRHFDHIFLE